MITEAQGLIEILKARGMTHKVIAQKCNTTEFSIGRWLHGKCAPYPIFLERLRHVELESRPAVPR
jgi:hypothetical protein